MRTEESQRRRPLGVMAHPRRERVVLPQGDAGELVVSAVETQLALSLGDPELQPPARWRRRRARLRRCLEEDPPRAALSGLGEGPVEVALEGPARGEEDPPARVKG